MQSSRIVKHSTVLDGHKTSIGLEDEFWTALKKIAASCDKTVSELVTEINAERQSSNLSSAIRIFIVDHYRSRLTAGSAVLNDSLPTSAHLK